MSENKKVGIWLRVSTTMQVNETDSLEHHQKRAEAYCISKDWNIIKHYSNLLIPCLSLYAQHPHFLFNVITYRAK